MYQMIIGNIHRSIGHSGVTNAMGSPGFAVEPNLKKPHMDVQWTTVCENECNMHQSLNQNTSDLTNHMLV